MPTDSSGPIAWVAARLTVVLALNSMVCVDGSLASDSALMFSLSVAGVVLCRQPCRPRGSAFQVEMVWRVTPAAGRRRRCVAARAAGTLNQIVATLGWTWAALTRLEG